MVRLSRFPRSAAATAVVIGLASTAAPAQVLLSEDFSTNPFDGPAPRATLGDAADPSRFSFAPGSLTAQYDSAAATTTARWALGTTLTQDSAFRFEVDAVVSSNVTGEPGGFAQIAFGLLNSLTTGPDRAGGGPDRGSFDSVMVDYYPSNNSMSGVPAVGPAIVESEGQPGGYYGNLHYPFGAESDLNQEGDLPRSTLLTFVLDYDPTTLIATLTIADSNGPLLINSNLGPDGDATTIQTLLSAGDVFAVDTFALALFNDSYVEFGVGAEGDVAFQRIEVTIPEPATAALVSLSLLAVTRRRRRP